MNVATISWLDAVMVLMLLGSIAFGFHQGFLRQLVLLIAMYVGTVLSAQYYEGVTKLILTYVPSSTTEVARVVAFVLLAVVFTIAATWLIWSAYRQTKLPSVVMLDETGGAILGGIIGLFVIGVALTLIQYAMGVPWPTAGPVKEFLHAGLINSALRDLFSSPLPVIQAALRPWLPSGIPLMLGS